MSDLGVIDSQIQKLIKSVLDTAIAASAQIPNGTIVAQSYNPSIQGPPLAPVVLFRKITARHFGFQARKYSFNGGSGLLEKTETWYERPTYQINSLITQNPVDDNSLSAYDIVSFCAAIIQSVEARATFLAGGVGVDRIADIRLVDSLDDSDRFISDPSFDFVLSYKNTLFSPSVSAVDVDGVVESAVGVTGQLDQPPV